MVQRELSEHLSYDAVQKIKKVSLDLSQKISSLHKLKQRMQKNDDDCKLLDEGRIPNGCKPLNFAYETPLLDSVPCDLMEWRVELDTNSSVRLAKKQIHSAYLKVMKQLDATIMSKQRDALREETKKSSFTRRILSCKPVNSDLFAELDLDFEGEDFGTKGMPDDVLQAKAEVIYTHTVQSAALTVQKKKELESTAAKSKDKILKQLMESAPAELLNQAIDQRIDQALSSASSSKGKGKADNRRDHRKIHPKGISRTYDASKAFVVSSVEQDADALRSCLHETTSTSKGSNNNDGGKGKGKGKHHGGKVGLDPKVANVIPNSGGYAKFRFANNIPKDKGKGKGKGKWKGKNRVSNMNSIVRLGLSMLKSGEYGAVPTDKDGGYAMVHKTSFVAALIQSMDQNTYDPDVMLHDLSAQDYVENYASLVQWIAEDARDPTLGHALLRDVRMGNRRFISRVIANVKTHKQPGNMGLRIIHSSPGLCISPAMRWISEHIRQFFSDKPHLLRDTDDLLFKLQSVVVSESAKLVRFDIRDYFMSGSHAQIADLA
ncbi:unnamed protein product, partial [Symbiodinium necroappetens]